MSKRFSKTERILVTLCVLGLALTGWLLFDLGESVGKKSARKVEFPSYVTHLYDLYEQSDFQLIEKKIPTLQIQARITYDGTVNEKIQVSNVPDMSGATVYDASHGHFEISPVFIGNNFWRHSVDGANWSALEYFNVEPKFLPGSAPKATANSTDILFDGHRAWATVMLSTPMAASGFVAQAALSSDFEGGQTKTFWSQLPSIDLSFYRTGEFYYRFRAVNEDQELSEWSEPIKFNVTTPDMPEPPMLIRARTEGVLGQEFHFAWKMEDQARAIYEIQDFNGKVVEKGDGLSLTFKPNAAGKYTIFEYALSEFGVRSLPSRVAVTVNEPYRRVPTAAELELAKLKKAFGSKKLAKNDTSEKREETPEENYEEERQPASVEGTSTINLARNPFYNQHYVGSLFSVASFLWSMQSTQQYYQHQPAPIATGIGIRVMQWWSRLGLEGMFKTSAVGVNGSGSAMKMRDAEGRMHFRFWTGMPFEIAKEMQMSVFLGFEDYTNHARYFSRQYDLVKFGTAMEFPWSQRWTLGGEFVVGLGMDNSNKEEISGHFHYYFKENWRFGLGYRVHLFSAGSEASAGENLLPYREGYAEGFSNIDYHF